MKKFVLFLLSLNLLTINNCLLAQGSLTPSGPPGPTMLTLSQVEPRTIVNAANTPGSGSDSYIISQPGSYCLAANLVGASNKEGINITTNNVTLDLKGFAVVGVAGSFSGIHLPNAITNITVRNGTVSGWGLSGVNSSSAASENVVFENLQVSSNGNYGIVVSGAAVVRDCNCQNNINSGISISGGMISGCAANYNSDGIDTFFGTVSGCLADNNTNTGISAYNGQVSGCTANNNDFGVFAETSAISGCTVNNNTNIGIECLNGGKVSGCIVQDNGTIGIYVSPATVSGCYVSGSAFSGIYVAQPGSEVIGNTSTGNNSGNSPNNAGIFILAANNRVEDNHVTASGNGGIAVYNGASYTNNLIIKNSVLGNGANNYITPNTQIVGPLITNSVSGIITNSNPWANFSF